jgi:Holliday junction resolvase-like predicted endonuclease
MPGLGLHDAGENVAILKDDMTGFIQKSSRHSKITGDFAEHLVLYWLSKHGFECARIDHTGIDLIARNPHTRELMGISVKSRSRSLGTEESAVLNHGNDISKAHDACQSFGCNSYFAIAVDAVDIDTKILVFILSAQKLKDVCAGSGSTQSWRMNAAALKRYQADSDIKAVEFAISRVSWWSPASASIEAPAIP